MDKFGDMDLFVRIVKSGGLAAAGREVGLSPASVSARLNALEQRFDARLLNRTTRRVSLTEEGQAFYEASIGILTEVTELENRLVSSRNQLAGQLNITTTSDLGRYHIAPVISQLMKLHPGITTHLHLSDHIANLAELNVDVAVRIGKPTDSTLIAKRLAPNTRVLCASSAYIKTKGTPKIHSDLIKHDCLAMFQLLKPMTRWHLSKDGVEEVVQIKPVLSTNDGALVRQWALDGRGIALKSMVDIADDLKSKRLVRVLKNYSLGFQHGTEKNQADIYAVYPSRQYVPERVRVFIELLEAHFKADGL